MLYEDSNEPLMNKERTAIGQFLHISKVDYQRERLDVGDYTDKETFWVERKKGLDYYSSLTNGHLFEQLYRMKNKPGFKVLLFVGDWYSFIGMIFGKYGFGEGCRTIASRYKVHAMGIMFIECVDEMTTAKEIINLMKYAKNAEKPMQITGPDHKYVKDLRKSLLLGLPEIASVEKTEKILEKYDNLYSFITECIDNPDLVVETLKGSRIGSKTIAWIKTIFESTGDVINETINQTRTFKDMSAGAKIHSEPNRKVPRNKKFYR